MHKIYEILNKVNNKLYIGMTKRDVNIRLKEHSKAKSIIGSAIRKYNIQNFKISILEEVETHVEACSIEQYYIGLKGTYGCYNQTKGGDGGVGRYWSPEQKLHLKKLKIGIPRAEKDIEHIRIGVEQRRDYEGENNPNYGNGYKQKGTANGRHSQNYTGDILEVGKKISQSLKNSAKNKKGNNPQSKKFYVWDSLTDSYTDIDPGYLIDFCQVFNIKHMGLRGTLVSKKPSAGGSSKGYQLFEGTYDE